MTVPNSHEQVYIKTTPSLILKDTDFTYIHSFHFIRERDKVLQTVRFDSQQTKCFLIVGRSFHPGRQIAKDSKHHREGNNCLKEIVSNTRLDLQTGSDFSGFFLQTVLNVHLLHDLLYLTVLKILTILRQLFFFYTSVHCMFNYFAQVCKTIFFCCTVNQLFFYCTAK